MELHGYDENVTYTMLCADQLVSRAVIYSWDTFSAVYWLH